MHKHLVRVYTLALDLLMLILLLAAPVITQDKPEKQNADPAGPNAEFKQNAADVAASMIERRGQKRA